MSGRTDLEQLVYQMSADVNGLKRDTQKALGIVRKSARDSQREMDKAGDNLWSRFFNRSDAGRALDGALAPALGGAKMAALGAGAGAAFVAGLTGAIAGFSAAAAFADEIDDAANKSKVGVEALQEYRFALRIAGGEAKNADAALASFNKTLGLAQSGYSKQLKIFTALGFTKEELAKVKHGEELLPVVADRINELASEAQRAAILEKLGLGEMEPLLRRGSDGMAELRDEAQKLGVVLSADLVAAGADAQEKMETLTDVIKVQLAGAFVSLAPEITAATEELAKFVKKSAEFLHSQNGGRFKRALSAASKAGWMGPTGALNAFMAGWNAPAPVDYSSMAAPDRTFTTSPGRSGTRTLDVSTPSKSKAAKSTFKELNWRGLDTVQESTIVDLVNSLGAMVDAAKEIDPTFKSVDDVSGALVDSLRARQDEIRDTVAWGLEGGLWAGVEDGLPGLLDYFGNQLKATVIRSLAESLTDKIMKSGSSGLINSLGSLFGARANGGAVVKGRSYLVGERGMPEVFTPGASGNITPVNRMGGDGGGGGGVFHFDLRGAVVTQDLLNQMNAIGASAAIAGAQGGAAIVAKQVGRQRRTSLRR